jgi:hypothetical protein
MAVSIARLSATRSGAGALAALSTLILLLLLNAPVMGQLMGHFGMSYSDAALVVALVASGSIVLFWFFPWLIPFLGTLRLILIFAGTGAVIGW